MQNNLGQFLAKRAFLSPSLEAYVEGDGSYRLTYAELNARANQLANALVDDGLQKIADMDEPEEEDTTELAAGEAAEGEDGKAPAMPVDSEDPFASARMPMFEDITPDEITKE